MIIQNKMPAPTLQDMYGRTNVNPLACKTTSFGLIYDKHLKQLKQLKDFVKDKALIGIRIPGPKDILEYSNIYDTIVSQGIDCYWSTMPYGFKRTNVGTVSAHSGLFIIDPIQVNINLIKLLYAGDTEVYSSNDLLKDIRIL